MLVSSVVQIQSNRCSLYRMCYSTSFQKIFRFFHNIEACMEASVFSITSEWNAKYMNERMIYGKSTD